MEYYSALKRQAVYDHVPDYTLITWLIMHDHVPDYTLITRLHMH